MDNDLYTLRNTLDLTSMDTLSRLWKETWCKLYRREILGREFGDASEYEDLILIAINNGGRKHRTSLFKWGYMRESHWRSLYCVMAVPIISRLNF